MDVRVQFGTPRDVTPGNLDGVVIRFSFTVTWPGEGARKDVVAEHRIDVWIAGSLYSIWGFGHPFERGRSEDAIKTLFQFSKEEVERKLKTRSLSEHEEIKLYDSSEMKENPYDVDKIGYPSESSFTVTIPDPPSSEVTSADPDGPVIPNVFISYSWDNDAHRDWTRKLAERLRGDGANVTLDQWHLAPGDQMAEFMERAVRDNDLVLIICTPRYKQKSDARAGGVGYEGDIMTAEVLSMRNHRKFIPILRAGLWKQAAPSWLVGKFYINLSGDPYSEDQYHDLVSTVHNQHPSPPPVGSLPVPARSSRRTARQDSVSQVAQPIAIEGVVVDEVTLPKNDGMRGDALYTIPFKLTRRPSPTWEEAFIGAWNHPSRFRPGHRPGIARVSGDKLLLDGTTIEEVERYHRETLKLAIEQANHAEKRQAEEEERRRKKEKQQAEQHRENVDDVAKRLRFD